MNKRESEMIAQRVVEKLEALRLERECQMIIEDTERLHDYMEEHFQYYPPFKFEQVDTPKKGLLRRMIDIIQVKSGGFL
jgi:hypothetical protein